MTTSETQINELDGDDLWLLVVVACDGDDWRGGGGSGSCRSNEGQ